MEGRELTREEVEAIGRKNWELRRDWTTYDDDIMGEPVSPELQAEIEEYEAHDPHKPTTQGLEELARQQELSADFSKPYQWVKPEEYADEAPRMGRIIDSNEFIRILRNDCKLKCWYGTPQEHENKVIVGLYVQAEPGAPLSYIGWVQQGWMPEYEMINFDSHGVPLNSKHRGWRTVLMQLIMKGALPEELATRVFGEARGPASTRYNRFLHDWRNRPRHETAGSANVAAVSAEAPAPDTPEDEPTTRCAECNRRVGHNQDCSKFKELVGA